MWQQMKGLAIWLVNWLIPLFYLLIITVCIKLNFRFIISQIPIYDSIEYPIIYSIISINYISFFFSALKSPGYSKDTSLVQRLQTSPKTSKFFKPNNILYFNNCQCKTCKLTKIPRSKHCSICKNCVLLYDHHCIWLNNCVGYANYKWFILYLISMLSIFGYGLVLSTRFLLIYWNSNLWNNSFSFKNLNTLRTWDIKAIAKNYVLIYYNTWKVVVTAIKSSHSTKASFQSLAFKFAIIFIILSVLFGFIITVFLHGICKNVGYLGMTENEKYKWGCIQEMVEYQQLFKFWIESEEEKTTYMNELLFDSEKKKHFIYLAKYYYYRVDSPQTSQEFKPERFETCFDIVKLNLLGKKKKNLNAENDTAAKDNSSEKPARIVKYFTLNSYDEKEIRIVFENRHQAQRVNSIDEIHNIYDHEDFNRNISLIF